MAVWIKKYFSVSAARLWIKNYFSVSAASFWTSNSGQNKGLMGSEMNQNGRSANMEVDKLQIVSNEKQNARAEVLNTYVDDVSKKLRNVYKLSSNCCIHKVPRFLRDADEKAYTPQLLSIGPFHNGTPMLQPMEEHKWRYLKDFLSKDSLKDVGYYTKILETLEEKVRQSYGEVIKMKKEHFVQMILLDGCFIVELILKYCMEDTRHADDPIFSTSWMLTAIMLDMALLENQLPFFVLEHLFNLINGPDQRYGASLLKLTIKFYKRNKVLGKKFLSKKISYKTFGEVKHFVQLLSQRHVFPGKETSKSKGYVFPRKEASKRKDDLVFIPNATELQKAGVKFIRREKGKSNSFMDVKFSRKVFSKIPFRGVFEIPRIKIDSGSNIIIRNIIAYEHFDRPPCCISQYIALMDSLIDTAADVLLLRDCEIINSWLCDDQELADLIKKLRVGAMNVENESFYYAQLFEEVNTYYKQKWHKLLAILQGDYFKTPWSIISFLAAVVLLVCTVLQTVWSMKK